MFSNLSPASCIYLIFCYYKSEKNERGERNMKFDINALIQKQKRPIKDKKQLSAELKKLLSKKKILGFKNIKLMP